MNKRTKLRIVFIIPSLHTGGSERVMLHLVRHLDRNKFDLILLVLKQEGGMLRFVPDDIQVVYFHFTRTVYSVFSILLAVRKYRPDILFSTLGHVNLLVALLKPFLPKKCFLIARESSIVSIRNRDERYPKVFDFLFKSVYKRFHRIICQSEYMKNDLILNFAIPENQITVINNPVDFTLMPSPVENTGMPLFISVGQLRPEKGYERIIKALAHCKLEFRYNIIGGGNQDKIQNVINECKLEHKTVLLGASANPFDAMASADCLLLGSYYEGFPNVILEANACGVPVIAFRAPGGHNEIIQQGVNGWFVDSPEQLCELLRRKVYRSIDKEKIIKMTRERFDLPKIIGQYEATLLEGNYTSFTQK